METLRNLEPEEFEFHGTQGFEILRQRIQMMANILGECVYITGHAQKVTNLRLTPSSQFTPRYNVCIFYACWPKSWRYDGKYKNVFEEMK